MIHRRRLVSATVTAGASLVLLAWMGHAQEPLSSTPFTGPEFVEADCPMPFDHPRGLHVDCGYVSVLEDRGRPDGNVIRLAVARLRASVPSPHPDPVIYLAGGPGAGGPGASGLEQIERFIDDARFIWEERDLILLDQRGVGHSEPRLECPAYLRERAGLRDLGVNPDEDPQRTVDALLKCKRTLSEQGIDVSAYTAVAVAADVVDLAAAMGYEIYNLYGSAFGTKLALTVMRNFPGKLRGVILDGVQPPQVNLTETTYANAASALEALFRHCEANRECAQRYPDLEQDLWQMVDRYTEHPTTTSKFAPYVSESSDEEVDGHFMMWRVMGSLVSDSWIPYLPFLLHRIADGDRDVISAFIVPLGRIRRSPIDNTAAWASLLCHSEGRFTDRSRVLADRAAHPRMVDPETPDLIPALCAVWHDPTVEPVDRTPVASDIPTLLLSGEFDPTTPPRWADLAAEALSRSYSFVVPMAGHGVGVDTPCGRKLVEAFLDTPSHDPSPACDPIADRNEHRFRTIFLNRGMRMNMVPSVKTWTLGYGALAVLLIHLSAMIGWALGAAFQRFRHSPDTTPRSVRPRTTAAALLAVSVGFWWLTSAGRDVLFIVVFHLWFPWVPRWFVDSFFVFTAPIDLRLMSDEMLRNFGYYPWVRPLFVIPYLTSAATLYVLYLAFRSWRETWWNGFGRVHYSIVAITLAWYPLHLALWGFIP